MVDKVKPEVPSPGSKVRILRVAAWAAALIGIMSGLLVIVHYWPSLKTTNDQQAGPPPASAPANPPAPAAPAPKVADSRCNLAGTVFVNQLQRCVFPLR